MPVELARVLEPMDRVFGKIAAAIVVATAVAIAAAIGRVL